MIKSRGKKRGSCNPKATWRACSARKLRIAHPRGEQPLNLRLSRSFVYSAKAAQLSSHGEQRNATSGLPTNDSQCESATHSLRVYPFLSCFHLDYERPHQRFNSLCVFCTICCSGSSTLASAALSLPITVSRNVDKPLRLLRKPSSFVSLATSLARPNIRSESSAADP